MEWNRKCVDRGRQRQTEKEADRVRQKQGDTELEADRGIGRKR